MTQVRVITKSFDMDKLAQEFERDVQDFKQEVLEEIARVVAQTSPVDSGTYVRNHEVGLRSGSFKRNVIRDPDAPRKSRGEPVDETGAREFGLNGMLGDIAALDMTSSNFVFRNAVVYAPYVEEEFAVYAQARRDVQRIVREEAEKIGSRARWAS